MSAKKSKTFFKTLTAILVLLLFFGGYYIYSSGIFGAKVLMLNSFAIHLKI